MFKSNKGFTLVELIVVIAILAILAGVAVPAYTGYIKKANEAADTQVLSAMNTAFAAACTENMKVPADVTAVTVTVTESKVVGITELTVTGDTDGSIASAIASDFNTYFAGNEATVLKYYGSFTYANGNFTGVAK